MVMRAIIKYNLNGGNNMRLNEIVYQCVAEHTGGEAFFDMLDRLISSETEVLKALLSSIFDFHFFNHDIDYNKLTVIVSGKFGQQMKQYVESNKDLGDFNLVVVEGGLRQAQIQDHEQYESLIKGRYCFFIDDSYFLGRTANKIKSMVCELGGVFCQTIVAYDGSRILESDVASFFRYYDHFGVDRNDR